MVLNMVLGPKRRGSGLGCRKPGEEEGRRFSNTNSAILLSIFCSHQKNPCPRNTGRNKQEEAGNSYGTSG